MIKYIRIFIISLLFVNISFSQQGIYGFIMTETDSTAVQNAYVVLSRLPQNKVVKYTLSDDQGRFDIETSLPRGIYRLKVHHLQYNAWQQDIAIDSVLKKPIHLKIYLSEKSNKLDEVTIKVEKPIAVKKDTIIYHLKYFTKTNDDNLEAVLKRMDGFEISDDGEITIKHKKIQKVLINGKEVSNNGAGLITKSIDPHKINKIEVRFKEKDSQIKESMLNSTDYAVLDIKLKKNLKSPFFGKIFLKPTYQNKYLTGGYANVFSLKRKLKFHFFGEYDPLGEPIINLSHIKNIGREALSKIFERPTDYNEIVHKQGYEDEIYGFKDFKQHKSGIIGITVNFDINKHWQIFFGSFNAYNYLASNLTTRQIDLQNNTTQYSMAHPHQNLSSKNKLEIRYDNPSTKIRYDANLVAENIDNKQNLNFDNQNFFINYRDQGSQRSWYHNLLLEKKLSDQWGIDVKMNYSQINQLTNIYLKHNDQATGILLSGQTQNPAYRFEQNSISGFKDYFMSSALHFTTDSYEIVNRIVYQNRRFSFLQSGYNETTQTNIDDFSQNSTLYQYQDIRNKFYFSKFSDHWQFNANLSLGHIIKSPDYQHIKKEYFVNYSTALSYREGMGFSANISYKNHLTDYSLLKQIMVKKITDYNLIRLPTVYPRTREILTEFSISKNWNIFEMDVAVLNGHSTNKYELEPTETLFVYQKRGISKTMYNMVSFTFTKKIRNTKITLEPEQIYHLTHNKLGQEENTSESNILLLGLKWDYLPKSKRLNYKIYPKYTFFNFKNSLSDQRNNQNMFSVKTLATYQLVKKYLNVGCSFRYVYFNGLSNGTYYNTGLSLNGVYHKIHWKMEASNLTNQQYFFTQTDTPVFLYTNRHRIFERYISLTMQYSF